MLYKKNDIIFALQVVSVCKPTFECCVWSLKDGSKVIHVVLQTNGVKYKCFRAKYVKFLLSLYILKDTNIPYLLLVQILLVFCTAVI